MGFSPAMLIFSLSAKDWVGSSEGGLEMGVCGGRAASVEGEVIDANGLMVDCALENDMENGFVELASVVDCPELPKSALPRSCVAFTDSDCVTGGFLSSFLILAAGFLISRNARTLPTFFEHCFFLQQ